MKFDDISKIDKLKELAEQISELSHNDFVKLKAVMEAENIHGIAKGAVPTVSERENYVGYLTNLPGAVKFNSHGLFNEKDEPIHLEKVAKEIANHNGNVWTHVVCN